MKWLPWMTSVTMLSMVSCQLATGEDAVLVPATGDAAPIIVAEDAPPHTVEAVRELARLIEKISERSPEILHAAPDPLPRSAVWVGPHPQLGNAIPEVDFELHKPEETLLVSKGGQVAILGRDEIVEGVQIMSGTANAVYSFAQDMLGVRWLWPGEIGEDIPEAGEIRIPAQTVRYAPVFLQRALFYRMSDPAREGAWYVRQRLAHDSLHTEMGHAYGHWWTKYGETNPELFALQPDGTRSGFPSPQWAKICEGEPAVWELWLTEVKEKLKENPTKRTFGASQNDGSDAGICMDPRSVAWDHPDGPLQQYSWEGKSDRYVAMSDRTVHFANKLGEMLEERLPGEDLKVVIMAYGPSKPAPIEARPRENVIISYVGQFPISSDDWREREQSQFAEWSEKADFMVYRPNLFYYSGGWHGLPVITPRLVAEDFRFLADHNCRGITVDGTPNHYGTQGLQYYVMAQLMWDPYLDVDALVEDFCQRGFGPAAQPVREYFALMEKAQLAVLNHPEWFPGMGTVRRPLSELILPIAYSPELLDKADRKLAQAAEALKGAPEIYRERLDSIQRAQEFTRLMINTVLVMNEVRHSEGRNYEAVEEAVRLVDAREEFFREEAEIARSGGRIPVVDAHRIRTTWIENRKLEDWLGPVSDEYLQAAAEAREAGIPVVSAWEPERKIESESVIAKLASPATLRWTGAARDESWQNRANWEALAVTSQWVPAPEPPPNSAKVELGDHVASPGPQVLRLNRDVEVESVSITASDPANSYLIANREDEDGGIDADSTRISTLVLTGSTPIRQATQTEADLEIDIPVRFADPESEMDLRSEHGAEVKLNRADDKAALPSAETSQEIKLPASLPPTLSSGPVVVFGDSTTARRGKIDVYADLLANAFGDAEWDVEVVNAGVGGNTTVMARQRFERDVLAHHPSAIVIQFGINDSAVDVWKDPPVSEPRVSLEDYRENLRFFVNEGRKHGSEVILMTPNALRWTPKLRNLYGKSPYDLEDENGLNNVLEGYAQAVREVAYEKGVPLVDVFAAYAEQPGPSQDALLSDGMHPNSKGHQLVGNLLLTRWLAMTRQELRTIE